MLYLGMQRGVPRMSSSLRSWLSAERTCLLLIHLIQERHSRKWGLDRITEGEALRHLCSCITQPAAQGIPLYGLSDFVRVL
jgi:hypothetical protein